MSQSQKNDPSSSSSKANNINQHYGTLDGVPRSSLIVRTEDLYYCRQKPCRMPHAGAPTAFSSVYKLRDHDKEHHDRTPPTEHWDCSVEGCDRKGDNGFPGDNSYYEMRTHEVDVHGYYVDFELQKRPDWPKPDGWRVM
ncbi:uncharacterized protein LTR77_006691 [Saxophila tyrrhenica]|uniref:C2H2-type domain-containing protein n=1 Tax=Saxophila tyrrhenica TaxID=1690608 RepID=A0AAV9P615_9PEZI|nr:hypothetical protein LTR77_006691 [Saxophila tyrrhenica]